MALQKLKPSDIKDTIHVIEVSEATGEVIEYSKALYTEEGENKLANNKRYKVSEKELHKFLNDDFGSFFFYFYNKLDCYDIKPQHKMRFLHLASHLDYNNGNIVIKGDYNLKVRPTRQNIKDILNLKEAEFKNTMKALTECGLLIKDDKYYNVDTSCSIRGVVADRNKKEYTRVFIATIRDLYNKCTPKQHKQLYYLFKILPKINVHFNVPCYNIDCDVMRDIVPMTLSDVCKAIDYDETHSGRLWNILRGFKIGDDYVICKYTVDNNKEYIAINPRLYYAGNQIENVSYLIGIFDMVK